MLADRLALTLFDQEAPISRHLYERKLRLSARLFLEQVQQLQEVGAVSPGWVRERLARLDEWMAGRLSGQNVLALAREVELMCPDWVALLPRLLASRYEELRVARLWAALLNPEALYRLRAAIEDERGIGGHSNG